MPTDPPPHITLYFRQAGSDKIYHAAVEPSGDGFVVTFAFGRRGSTLSTGTKTNTPVSLAEAIAIYNKLVKEKTGKGYTPGEDGKPYQLTAKQDRATGLAPQLLNSIDDDKLEPLLDDDRWLMQEKFDGRRTLVVKTGSEVTGVNRTGLSIAVTVEIVKAVQKLPADSCLLDGESVGDRYHTFDLLEIDGTDIRRLPYTERLDKLIALTKPLKDDTIRRAETATGKTAKQEMLKRLRDGRREGAVFKRADAPYTPGRPSGGGNQLKLKFHATASCIVAAGRVNKRSVALELFDNKTKVAVGNVTVPVNQQIPRPDEVVEIRYLYAFPGGSLYHPVYLGPRDDIHPADCTTSQLKFKPEAEDA